MPTITVPAGFETAELTETINLLPCLPSQLQGNITFPFEGLRGTLAAIQRTQFSLCLVQTAPYCASPPTANRGREGDTRFIPIPHTPIRSELQACDYSGLRKWDLSGVIGLVDFAEEVLKEQADMKAKLEETRRYREYRAFYGEILDADGSLLIDLFKAFGFTPTEVTFNFASPSFNIRAACMKVLRAIECCYNNGTYSAVRIAVNSDVFDALTNHPSVVDIFKRCCDQQSKLTGDVRKGFLYGGIWWEEVVNKGCFVKPDGTIMAVDYFASPTDPATNRQYTVPVGVTRLEGTRNLYKTYGAPAQTVTGVNRTATQEYYTTIEPLCHERGFEMIASMNLLPLLTQPCTGVRTKFLI